MALRIPSPKLEPFGAGTSSPYQLSNDSDTTMVVEGTLVVGPIITPIAQEMEHNLGPGNRHEIVRPTQVAHDSMTHL